MIPIHRLPCPIGYKRRAKNAFEQLEVFFHQKNENYRQKNIPFRNIISPEVRDVLMGSFNHKCAYCETPPIGSALVITHFRPKLHYWWLAYDWENLHVACQACTTSKGGRFPLTNERVRAPRWLGPGAPTKSEIPLLIDPCSDSPTGHFLFDLNGKVSSDTYQGKATIDTFGLNREPLVAARSSQLHLVSEHVKNLTGASKPNEKSTNQILQNSIRSLHELIKDSAPYAAASRHFVSQHLAKANILFSDLIKDLVENTTPTKNSSRIRLDYETHEAEIEKFSIDHLHPHSFKNKSDIPGPVENPIQQTTRYFAKRRTIARIKIKNFKAIQSLDITFSSAPDVISSWLMLLGENATGKSSILKAVALALAGEAHRNELNIKPIDVLTRGKTKGYVKIWLSGVREEIELHFSASRSVFKGDVEPKVLLLGYGSTRLLPKPYDAPNHLVKNIRIGNLYDPTMRLVAVENWLGSLKPRQFEMAIKVISKLLPSDLDCDFYINRRRSVADPRKVLAQLHGIKVSLEELSDGYQSVVALAADILSVVLPVWQYGVGQAEGIVLIDEIDSHLHPTWKMRIVPALRECFPNVQFVTTTHDPLCLKGLVAGEVVVLKRGRRGIIRALEDLPSPEGMTMDQLLTSEHFGLGSTIDPVIEQKMREYYFLLSKESRTVAQEQKLKKLKASLSQLNYMGRTRREQLMLEVIDAFLSQEVVSGKNKQVKRRTEMLSSLIDRWEARGI